MLINKNPKLKKTESFFTLFVRRKKRIILALLTAFYPYQQKPVNWLFKTTQPPEWQTYLSLTYTKP